MNKLLSVVVVLCLVGCKSEDSSSTEKPSASTEEPESAEASEPVTRLNVTGNLVFTEGLWRNKTSWKPHTGGIYKLREGKGRGEIALWSGAVREGKRHGAWSEYHSNGAKTSETNYKKGNRHGLETHSNMGGTKTSETNFKDGKKHGLETYFHSDGAKALETNYKEGNRHGLRTEFSKDGTRKQETNYKEGNRHGVEGEWKEF